MEHIIQNPYYSQSDNDSNCLDFQLSFLIRTAEDAQRIAATIYEFVFDCEAELHELSKLEPILARWNDPGFSSCATQAQEILERLDEMLTETWEDFATLETIRIPIYALQMAISRRAENESVS